jgi:Fe-S cluster assembly iron-binding protein IscA
MSYKVKAIKELAQEIKAAGFRVFIAKSGTHGFYTDAAGTKVVSFQFDLGGFKFTGNYKTSQPSRTGTGWQLQDGSFEDMFKQMPPNWAVGSGIDWKYTTLEQHLKTYQASSQYVEVGVE